MEIIFELIKYCMEKNKNKEIVTIDRVFNETKEIINNFYETFDYLMNQKYKTIYDFIKEINKKRYPFKSSRDEIRVIAKTYSSYYDKTVDNKLFIIGVLGILQGGINSSFENVIRRYIKDIIGDKNDDQFIKYDYFKKYLLEYPDISFVFRAGATHTLLSIEHRINNYLYYGYDLDDEWVIEKLVEYEVTSQREKIEKCWRVVCESYYRMKMDNKVF